MNIFMFPDCARERGGPGGSVFIWRVGFCVARSD